eukprot:scaffold2812_cov172-Ochromonas_danica.AAC.4
MGFIRLSSHCGVEMGKKRDVALMAKVSRENNERERGGGGFAHKPFFHIALLRIMPSHNSQIARLNACY